MIPIPVILSYGKAAGLDNLFLFTCYGTWHGALEDGQYHHSRLGVSLNITRRYTGTLSEVDF